MSQITTHVLDTAAGRPAADLGVALYRRVRSESDESGEGGESSWEELARGTTNADGRVADLLDPDIVLDAGCYRVRFNTGPYLEQAVGDAFYPWADVVFNINAGGEHYHIPLLLSPFGYSTYRGS
ncbi:MAG: hydroxyisourate hydrolase [Pseudomonadota bacterium]